MAKKVLVIPQQVAVVDEGANNHPNHAVWSVRRVLCSRSAQNPDLAPEQNKDDHEAKDAESADSKHGDVEEADETGTETDSQKVDTQEEEKVENGPETNQAVAPENLRKGRNSSRPVKKVE